ncbi:MAG: dihydrofolate reductase family protein [Myxococcota bacterium]
MGRIRAFLAMSLDGYIAGPNDDLSWLPVDDRPGPGAVDLDAFLSGIGCMLMGRRTYDVAAGFGSWVYGEIPVLVPTHRALDPVRDTVRAVQGPISALLDEALALAGGKDVYVDGGAIVQQVLEADRLDELVVTVVPLVLGGGVPLFAAPASARPFRFEPPSPYGSMIQLTATRARA